MTIYLYVQLPWVLRVYKKPLFPVLLIGFERIWSVAMSVYATRRSKLAHFTCTVRKTMREDDWGRYLHHMKYTEVSRHCHKIPRLHHKAGVL